MRRVLFCVAFILFLTHSALAANYYVRDGGTGGGSTWSDAADQLPTTLVRGNVYYIAGGSYPGKTFNTAASGTTLITIKGATIADHGTGTGWNDSYSVENTQATWTSGVWFSTSYWVFDGSVGPVWSKTTTDYGFKFSVMNYPLSVYNTSSNISDITISHIYALAPSGDTEKFFVSTDNSSRSVSNVTISHCLTDGWQCAYWATSPGLTFDNWIFEYNMVLNGYSSIAHHGEDINNNYSYMTNQIIRYNWFEGRSSGTGVIVANNNDTLNCQVYGNVFKNMTAGNGTITGTSEGNLISPQIYNNTFSGNGDGNWLGPYITGTEVVRNNLLYNQSAGGVGGDYDAFFSCTSLPSEAHIQTGSGSPFVSTTDYHLTSATNAGLTLSSPYNQDVFGSTRGSDGTWDRGAIEYGTGSDTTAPSVTISTADPSNISVDTLSISGSASDAVGVTACKWRIGSAPDGSNGTALSGTTSWSGTATGFSSGANTLYAGCTDAAGNWGSDSMVVNYTPPSSFRVGPVGGTLSGGTIQ